MKKIPFVPLLLIIVSIILIVLKKNETIEISWFVATLPVYILPVIFLLIFFCVFQISLKNKTKKIMKNLFSKFLKALVSFVVLMSAVLVFVIGLELFVAGGPWTWSNILFVSPVWIKYIYAIAMIISFLFVFFIIFFYLYYLPKIKSASSFKCKNVGSTLIRKGEYVIFIRNPVYDCIRVESISYDEAVFREEMFLEALEDVAPMATGLFIVSDKNFHK
jgi:hypothetical protein